MESIGSDCQELKRDYDACFNTWFKESFLKGKTEDACAPLFKAYQTCVKASRRDVWSFVCRKTYTW